VAIAICQEQRIGLNASSGLLVSCDFLKLREHPNAERFRGSVDINTAHSSKGNAPADGNNSLGFVSLQTRHGQSAAKLRFQADILAGGESSQSVREGVFLPKRQSVLKRQSVPCESSVPWRTVSAKAVT